MQTEKGVQGHRDGSEQHSKLWSQQVSCGIRWSQQCVSLASCQRDISKALVGNVTEYAENKLPLDIVRDSAAIEPCFPPDWPEVMQS